MADLERIVRFEPGYDRRITPEGKNYGVHGMQIRFLLRGPKGVMQFLIMTDWFPPMTVREYAVFHPQPVNAYRPIPADVGYHAYHPQYEDQTPIRDECSFLNGAPCYYDGSSLYADEVYDEFSVDGDAAVWRALEQRYDQLIGPEGSEAE